MGKREKKKKRSQPGSLKPPLLNSNQNLCKVVNPPGEDIETDVRKQNVIPSEDK